MTVRNEVSSAKLAMEFMRRLVVGFRGLYRSLERAKINKLVVHADAGSIRLFSPGIVCTYGNSSESGGTSQLSSLVAIILMARNLSKIVLAAIKTVSVDVINFFTMPPHYKSVKGNQLSFTPWHSGKIGDSILVSWSCFLKSPLKMADHIRVVVVDHCRLALREWDYNHILIIPNLGDIK